MALTAKSQGGEITVDEHFVTIRRKGFFAKTQHGFTKGEKRISIASITAVQFKKPGLANGYIQFTVGGGIESRKGLLAANKDENSVVFTSFAAKDFERIRDYVESLIAQRHSPDPVASRPGVIDIPTQLRELAKLREDGILTEAEFEAQKAKLLAE